MEGYGVAGGNPGCLGAKEGVRTHMHTYRELPLPVGLMVCKKNLEKPREHPEHANSTPGVTNVVPTRTWYYSWATHGVLGGPHE